MKAQPLFLASFLASAAALAASLGAFSACSKKALPCAPNTSITCTCPGGGNSNQVCVADGSQYGACNCNSGSGPTTTTGSVTTGQTSTGSAPAGAGGFGGNPTIGGCSPGMGGANACDAGDCSKCSQSACAHSSCKSCYDDCAGDADCTAINTCVPMCAKGDFKCFQNCFMAHPNGQMKWATLAKCLYCKPGVCAGDCPDEVMFCPSLGG